ncbi:MAG: hypothetical protein K2I95_06830 [Treponemataceae bacterium]|nr:hypothetical protein [Treponemataceae bacterium]
MNGKEMNLSPLPDEAIGPSRRARTSVLHSTISTMRTQLSAAFRKFMQISEKIHPVYH